MLLGYGGYLSGTKSYFSLLSLIPLSFLDCSSHFPLSQFSSEFDMCLSTDTSLEICVATFSVFFHFHK